MCISLTSGFQDASGLWLLSLRKKACNSNFPICSNRRKSWCWRPIWTTNLSTLDHVKCVDPSLQDFNWGHIWGHSAGHPTDTEPSDTRWRHGFQHRVVLVKLMDNKLALAKAELFLLNLSSFWFPTSMWTHTHILSCMSSQISLQIKSFLVVCPLDSHDDVFWCYCFKAQHSTYTRFFSSVLLIAEM